MVSTSILVLIICGLVIALIWVSQRCIHWKDSHSSAAADREFQYKQYKKEQEKYTEVQRLHHRECVEVDRQREIVQGLDSEISDLKEVIDIFSLDADGEGFDPEKMLVFKDSVSSLHAMMDAFHNEKESKEDKE